LIVERSLTRLGHGTRTSNFTYPVTPGYLQIQPYSECLQGHVGFLSAAETHKATLKLAGIEALETLPTAGPDSGDMWDSLEAI
jgi:hypothetical protein